MRAPVLAVALALGCASTPPEPVSPPAPAPEPAAEVRAPRGSLFRDDVDAAVEEGLGSFLQAVSVKAHLEGGSFVGFRIVEVRPPEAWEGFDVRPGDVVTRINGLPIEREMQAFRAFESLRNAKSIEVTLLRGGEEKKVVISIVERPSASAKAPERVSRR